MYEYAARLIRVVDGDTVWVDVDLGFDAHRHIDLRLLGIQAPELNTPEGETAKTTLEHLIWSYARDGVFLVRTVKDHHDLYGRYLAMLVGWHEDGSECDINERMVELARGVDWDGSSPKPTGIVGTE
jgi:endonuclease YncB( thermonuclease family)